MRKKFVVGDYQYTRPTSGRGRYYSYASWAKNESKSFSWTAPTGYGYVTDEDENNIVFNVFQKPPGFDEEYSFKYGTSASYSSDNVTVTYGGAQSVTITAKKALTNVRVVRDITFYSATAVDAEAADKGKSVYSDIPSTVTDEGTTSSVTCCDSAFLGCFNLIAAPQIPNTVTSMVEAFKGCSALVTAPAIPSSVNYMMGAFDSCVSLTGNIEVYNDSPSSDMFAGTQRDIFIIDKGSAFPANWKGVASRYSNVHFEADDNPAPVVSNFTLTRVSGVGETDYEPTGLYVYIQARVMVYDTLIPTFWTNEIKSVVLTRDGYAVTATWQPLPITDYPADVHCWVQIGDTSAHEFTLQISDSINDGSAEVKSRQSAVLTKVLTKSFALMDCCHDPLTDAEGIAFGKYAEQPDVFDVDMTAYFRQSISVYHNIYADGNVESEDGYVSAVDVFAANWAGFIQMFAGATPPTGWLLCDGSEVAVADYPTLYSVIGTTYNDGTETSGYFRLPDLKNRFPVGVGSDYALNDTGGSKYIQEHSHSFTQPTVNNGGGASITGGSHHHATNRKKNAASGSAIYVPDGGSTTNGISTTDTTHSHSLPNHAHSVQGGAVNAVKDVTAGNGGNLPPYIGINFIICTGEIS